MTRFKILNTYDARNEISKIDDYLLKMKPVERRLKCKANQDVELDQFVLFLRDCVLEPTKENHNKLTIAINQLKRLVEKYNLHTPSVINIIKTDGRDEWNSAYTRGNSIVLPSKKLDFYSEEDLVKLLVHEYFHVISRFNPGLRRNLYGLLGFVEIEDGLVPSSIMDRTLNNPDALILTGIANEKNQLEVPLITIKSDNVDDTKDILESIRIEVYLEGEKKLVDIEEAPVVKSSLMINVSHIQHPEETLAENFTHLLAQSGEIENTKLLNQMSKILRNDIKK